MATPERLEDRAAPGGGLLGIFWGAPVVEWVLGSLWTDGRTAAQVAPPSVAWHKAEYLDALAGFYADPGRLGLLLGEARQLMSITAVDDAMADWYLETARSRILEVAADLAQPGVADLDAADFASRLWWVDQFFMGLARSETPGGLSGELSLEGDDADGGFTMDYGGYGGYPPIAGPDTYEADHSTSGFTYVLDVPYPGVKWNDGDPYYPLSTLMVSTVTPPSHAQHFTLNSNGSFVYKPAAYYRSTGEAGPDTFVYRLTNPAGLSSQAQVSIYVHNNVPVGVDDQYMVHATIPPTPLVVPGQQGLPTVLANDGEADAQDREGLTVERYADVQHGTLALDPSGTFTYTPVEGYVGFDTFSYRVTDGMDWSGPATVTINVYNNPPIVENDGPYYIGFVDNGPAEPLIVSEPGVLGNDHDPDGDYPLTAIRVSDPSHGTLEYLHPEGDFKYIPNPGFTGEDSFQYVANDGIADSEVVATVRIRVFEVNLTVYNGQSGAAIGDATEESLGAFTVANLNDTDGDAVPDLLDMGVIGGNGFGRDEVDLMRLVIARPYPNFEGAITLTTTSANVALWALPIKSSVIAFAGFGQIQFTAQDFPPEGDKTIWVELTGVSSQPQDARIELTYRDKSDAVASTGVWAYLTDVEHDTRDATGILQEAPWTGMTEPPETMLKNEYGGTGLRPINVGTNLVGNAILVSHQIAPIGAQILVNFDYAQRVTYHSWWLDGAGNVERYEGDVFPDQVEEPNDDSTEEDESAVPNWGGMMFNFDAPGLDGCVPEAGQETFVMRGTFELFVRVGIEVDPEGDELMGSRASDYYEWHVRHRLVNSDFVWVRSTGDAQETAENDVGPGYIDVGELP